MMTPKTLCLFLNLKKLNARTSELKHVLHPVNYVKLKIILPKVPRVWSKSIICCTKVLGYLLTLKHCRVTFGVTFVLSLGTSYYDT